MPISWTQPMCVLCFIKNHPGRRPTTVRHPVAEICVDCGNSTTEGIYVRIDPAHATYPTNVG